MVSLIRFAFIVTKIIAYSVLLVLPVLDVLAVIKWSNKFVN